MALVVAVRPDTVATGLIGRTKAVLAVMDILTAVSYLVLAAGDLPPIHR
jgi:hypothetical protein